MSNQGTQSGPITGFPAQGLRNITRLVTGHNEAGEAVILQEDNGDHQSIMVNGIAVQNNIYSTDSVPADLNGNKDIEYANKTAVWSDSTLPPFVLPLVVAQSD
jgi:hypothetical protein